MPSTKIRGNTQIIDYTIDVGRLEQDFLDGADWDITNGAQDYGIRGVRLTPLNDDELASKFYVDSVAQGLQIHESSRVATTASLDALYDNVSAGVGSTLTNAGSQAALSIDDVSLIVDDRILIKDQAHQQVSVTFDSATPSDYSTDFVTIYDGADTAVHFWFDATGGDGTPGGATNPVQVDISGQSTSTGIALIFEAAVNAYTDSGDTEFYAYIDGTDASKVIVNNAQHGDVTDAATTDATYAAVATTVSATASGSPFNGIYIVTSTGSGSSNWVITRVEDFDNTPANEIHDGDFFFIEEGTTNGGNGYVQTEDAWPSGTISETVITWQQFSGAGQIIAGDGIDKAGNTISVDVTDILGEGLTESSNNIDIDWGGSGGDYGSATTVARSDHDHDSVYSPLGHDHSGSYVENAFTTINAPSGTDPAADSTTDTLNLATGGPITITGDSGTDTITFDIGADGILNEHINWGGAGETAIDAEDIPLNTSTGTYAGVATNIQEALEEIESNVSSNYTFRTIDTPSGTDPVADSSGDTLTLSSDNSTITITGDSGTDTVDFDLTADGVDETHLDLGSGSNQIDATTIPIDSGGTYAGAAANVQDALEELETNNLQFKTFVPTTGTNVIADSATDTLTLTSDNTTIVVTGDGANDELDFDIAVDGVDETHLDLGSGANQIDATTIPIDSGGTWAGSAANVQDALEELESDVSSHYAFLTVSTPSGTSPVAETTTDTLTLATGGPITITGDSGTDTVTFDIGTDSITDLHINWGTGANQISGGDIPLADSGAYFTTDDVESALQELAAAAPGFGVTRVFEETPAISHGTPTVTLANTPIAGTVRIYHNGLRAEDPNDYSISGATVTFTQNLLATPGQSDIIVCDYEY